MKRIFLLTIILVLSLLALFSCKVKERPGNTPDAASDNLIYGSETDTQLITNMDITDDAVYESLDSIVDSVYSKSGINQ